MVKVKFTSRLCRYDSLKLNIKWTSPRVQDRYWNYKVKGLRDQ